MVGNIWRRNFYSRQIFSNFGNAFFSFSSLSQNLGMDFFFPSRSRIVFFHYLPVPEVWEWNYPFPFPNSRNNLERCSNCYHFYLGNVICITIASHSDVNHVLTSSLKNDEILVKEISERLGIRDRG